MCLTEEQIRDLAAGQLEGEGAESARDHLKECPACQHLLEEWEANLAYAPVLRDALAGADVAEKLISDSFEFVDVWPEPLADEVSETQPGFIPDYQIIREIHRGGQGVVYEAIQLSTKRTVAVKVLLEGQLASRRDKWMFEREVKLVATLNHPYIVAVHDSGIIHGKYYFAMEYVSGKPLDTYIRISRPDTRQIIALFRKICDAVAHAHQRLVLHRDLKPLNILVRDDGQPCILDFGMAKALGDVPVSRPEFVSQRGDRMGTLHYMAPEQTRGEPDKIDTRTDVYALGAMLYEAVTGRRIHDWPPDPAECFRLIREQDPPRPSRAAHDSSLRQSGSRSRGLGSEIDAMVMKAIEKDPNRRYQSVSELLADLVACLEGRPIAAKSASSLYVLRKMAVKHSFESLVLLALVLAIGSGFTLLIQMQGKANAAKAQQQRSERALSEKNEGLGDFYALAQSALEYANFGWFLFEWQADRPKLAKKLCNNAPAGTPQRAVMAFLLDPNRSLADLLAELPAQAQCLGYFAAGERDLRAGRTTDAGRELRRSLETITPTYGWIKEAAEGRLEQLERSEK